jgi:hypothetical protein
MRELQEWVLHRERKQKDPSRFIVIGIVLALHFAIATLLILSSRTRLAFPTGRPIELVYLPSRVVPQKSPPTPKKENRTTQSETVRMPPSLPQNLSVITLPENANPAPPIDWALQAQAVASESASRGSTPSASDLLGKSPFAPPPAHHAGEEFSTVGGAAVFINEHCYQVSKKFADVPTGIANGMGTQTYCIRPSNEARGDLFDQLPAYKKLHPHAPNP